MKFEWKRQHIIILTLLLLLTIVSYTFTHRHFINPIEEEVKQVKDSLESEKKILTALRDKKVKGNSFNTSQDTQSKLPVLPVIDQFFMALERAENISNSVVMGFTQQGTSEFDLSSNEDSDMTDDENDSDDIVKENDSEVVKSKDTPSVDEAIQVNQMAFQINVQSPQFGDLLTFLEELKNIPRIIDVNTIEFEDEMTSDEETDMLKYTIVVSTFYDEGNSILKDEIPQYHYEPSADKKNPLLPD
ncbi:hypothetical protein [Pontibacillus yanchengensis]|uniref:Pilus assembly protein PilO n=1 Tax=Pontibacillus yanchengensis Y32 TaxID=1385514 RepID=A0A0A2TIM2_9BACI|nr:hypothetical protein [Pontibacillus yanchengensis]KGP73926.1 hypothetical protein N782_21255 [Pontibacillus yanchengensis Y32]